MPGAVEPPVVGLDLFDQTPEIGRMIHVLGVRQFMHEQIVHHLGLQEDQRAIQAHRAAGRAATPTRALAARTRHLVRGTRDLGQIVNVEA